jgi:hypothetical protein
VVRGGVCHDRGCNDTTYTYVFNNCLLVYPHSYSLQHRHALQVIDCDACVRDVRWIPKIVLLTLQKR